MVKIFDILFLIGAILLGFSVSLWLSIWSPDALMRDPLPLYRQAILTTQTIGKRHIQDVRLLGPDGETVRFKVSLPVKLPDQRMPSLILLSPFRDPDRNLRFFPRPGPNVIISYAQPYEVAAWESASLLGRAWIARRVAYRMPDSIAALIGWIGRQEWADAKRINLAGIGPAAVILPAVRRRAASTGQSVGGSILAYGGTDIQAMANASLAIESQWLRPIAAWLTGIMLRPLEPATHLPKIKGPFLLINARDDRTIPARSLEGIRELTPEPKTIATVQQRQGDNPPHIAKTIRVARNWLVAQGLLDP
jgi:pimeloyl-ACP methyl ester carboxylesterase